jgi:hypothetical protein
MFAELWSLLLKYLFLFFLFSIKLWHKLFIKNLHKDRIECFIINKLIF